MVAARFRDYYDRQAKERMESGVNQHSPPVNLPEGSKSDARDAAGKEFLIPPNSRELISPHARANRLRLKFRCRECG